MITPQLPLQAETIEEQAEWYAANLARVKQFKKEFAALEARLGAYTNDNGPIRTANGLVGPQPDGFAYDVDAIAAEFPALVSRLQLVIEGEPTAVLRAQSLVEEECGKAVTVELSTALDKAAVKAQMRMPGAAATKLAELVKPQGKLGVRS